MNQLCPKDCSVIVDGGWGNWGAWSSCSKTCGNGTATRSRVCDNPLPKNGGRDCVGPAIESQECFVQHCPVDAGWNQWSQWSLCSLTCGGGMRSHNRTCTNPSPQHGGRTCTGNGFEQQMCSNQSCPGKVDGGWTQWSQWSACSLTCEGGMRSRNRDCTNPPPQHRGKTCVGDGFEQQMCNNQSCPVYSV
ncbi:thrombospondin-2-like [Oculina patagonica]